jgi:hypothetical protein
MLKAISLRYHVSFIQNSPLLQNCCHRCKVPYIIGAHINQSFENRALRLLERTTWLALGKFGLSLATNWRLYPEYLVEITFSSWFSSALQENRLLPTALFPVGLRSRVIVLSLFICCLFNNAASNSDDILISPNKILFPHNNSPSYSMFTVSPSAIQRATYSTCQKLLKLFSVRVPREGLFEIIHCASINTFRYSYEISVYQYCHV